MFRVPTSDGKPWRAFVSVAGLRAALVSCLLTLSLASRARAEDLHAHLSWERPVGTLCPSSAVLSADVELLMGRVVFAPREQADLWVHGVIDDLATGVYVRIDVRDRRGNLLGTRELSAPAGECASLRRALGVVLALLLEQQVPARDHDTSSLAIAPAFALAIGMLSATLPRADMGFGLSLLLDPAVPVRLRADASYWLPVASETQRGVGATFQAVLLGLSVCPRLSSASSVFGWWVCAGAQLGALLAAPSMLRGPDRQTRLLAQPNVALAVSLRVGRHSSLEASVGVLANVLRPSFVYARGDGETVSAHRPGIVGAILRAALTID